MISSMEKLIGTKDTFGQTTRDELWHRKTKLLSRLVQENINVTTTLLMPRSFVHFIELRVLQQGSSKKNRAIITIEEIPGCKLPLLRQIRVNLAGLDGGNI